MTQEEQKYANIFLHDVERGDIQIEQGKTFREYIIEYQCRDKEDLIHRFSTYIGVDEDKLRDMMGLKLTEANINEFGRFDELKRTIDKNKAKKYFESVEHKKLSPPIINIKLDRILRNFILNGGMEMRNM